jgi:hypothetical protein
LAIHCWLLSLEQVCKKEGRLPDTIFHQFDGGSENVNKLFLGICELLINKGVCKKIVLSRLKVGHTHEDIDAIFALIWKEVRCSSILTPRQAAIRIKNALRNKTSEQKIIDLFVIPDYHAFMDGCIDKTLGRYGVSNYN